MNKIKRKSRSPIPRRERGLEQGGAKHRKQEEFKAVSEESKAKIQGERERESEPQDRREFCLVELHHCSNGLFSILCALSLFKQLHFYPDPRDPVMSKWNSLLKA